MNGMMTGALVGAVVTGVWLLRRGRRPRGIWRAARWVAPRVGRVGAQGVRFARRRLG